MRVLTITNLYPNPYQPRAPPTTASSCAASTSAPVRVISPISWTDELTARIKQKPSMRNRRAILDQITIAHPHYFYTPKLLRSALRPLLPR